MRESGASSVACRDSCFCTSKQNIRFQVGCTLDLSRMLWNGHAHCCCSWPLCSLPFNALRRRQLLPTLVFITCHVNPRADGQHINHTAMQKAVMPVLTRQLFQADDTLHLCPCACSMPPVPSWKKQASQRHYTTGSRRRRMWPRLRHMLGSPP